MTLLDLTVLDLKTNKYGLLDWNGKVILPVIFDSLSVERTGTTLLVDGGQHLQASPRDVMFLTEPNNHS